MSRLSGLNLDAIQSFAVFAESRNFSAAAELLHISQPALHVKVRRLSEVLGVPLYRRLGRNLELTRQGEEVARYGRELLARTDGFIQLLRTGRRRQPILLAAGAGAYLYLLGTALQKFLQSGEKQLRLLTLNRDEAIEAIRAGEAHLAVAPLETIDQDIEARPLTTVGQVLVVPRLHPLAIKKSIRLVDLAGSRIIVPPAGRPHREMVARMLQSANVDWEIAVEASGWQLMIQFVHMGMGVALVNAYCHIPKELIAIPVPELPGLKFHVFHLSGHATNEGGNDDERLVELRNLIIGYGNAWKTSK
jgi:DNA-binding transcriptional LysR family regulator